MCIAMCVSILVAYVHVHCNSDNMMLVFVLVVRGLLRLTLSLPSVEMTWVSKCNINPHPPPPRKANHSACAVGLENLSKCSGSLFAIYLQSPASVCCCWLVSAYSSIVFRYCCSFVSHTYIYIYTYLNLCRHVDGIL